MDNTEAQLGDSGLSTRGDGGEAKKGHSVSRPNPQAPTKPFTNLDARAISDGRVEARQASKDAMEAIQSGLRVLEDQLAAVDDAIHSVALALRVSQPPMSGKIDIRWWVTHGVRAPVLVRWEKRGKHSFPKRLLRYDAKPPHENFRLNHERTVELVKTAQELIARRDSLLRSLANIKRAIAQQSPHTMWAVEMGERARQLRYACADALVDAGYSVTPDIYD